MLAAWTTGDFARARALLHDDATFDGPMGETRGGGELEAVPDEAPDALASFFERAGQDPEWIRVLLWEALETSTDEAPIAGADERRLRYLDRVAWVEAEQAAGRLPADLDPTMLLLSLFGAALYPVLLPQIGEIALGKNIDFHPSENLNTVDFLVRLANALNMRYRPRVIQAVGEGQIFRVIRDRHVFVATFLRSLGHFFNRVSAVGFHRVHVHVAEQIWKFDEVRQRVLLGGVNLAKIFAQLGRNFVQVQFAKNFLFRFTGNEQLRIARFHL